jgi:hypothetical protein
LLLVADNRYAARYVATNMKTKAKSADRPKTSRRKTRRPRRRVAARPARPVATRSAPPATEPSAEVVDQASETEPVASFMSSKTVWLASFVALGTADFGSLANLSSSSFAVLNGLGAAGGAGLVATSAKALDKKNSVEDNLDAANNAAWGAQGLMYLVPSSLGAMEVALGFGLVGSTMQTAVGLRRIQRGVVSSDESLVKLGLLDLGTGLLWLAWDLIGARQPLFIGAYVVAKVGRETYANRKAFRGFLGSMKERALSTYEAATSALETALRAFEDGYDESFMGSEHASETDEPPAVAIRLGGRLLAGSP